MNLIWQVLYLALFGFYLLMLARLVAGVVLRFSKRWQPQRGASMTLEVVFSVTDPPLKGLRRVIPPLRLGTVAIDLAFMALLIIVWILMSVIVGPQMLQD